VEWNWRCAAAGVLLAACGDTAGVGPVQGITVSVVASDLEQVAPGGAAGVVIDRLRLVLGGIKLETAGTDGTVDWSLDESSVVEVDLSGEPVTARVAVTVPAGRYKELEVSVDKLEPGHAAEDPLIADHPELADASIVVNGRVVVNGTEEAFTFAAALDRDMEILLDPVLEIAADAEPTGIGVTLVLRAAGWFLSQSGEWLDPRDPAKRSPIESNIQDSFEAFEDGDLDGRPGPIVR
jgi:hypothetical protein